MNPTPHNILTLNSFFVELVIGGDLNAIGRGMTVKRMKSRSKNGEAHSDADEVGDVGIGAVPFGSDEADNASLSTTEQQQCSKINTATFEFLPI